MSEDTVEYGPLSGLVGCWKGDKGIDISPEPDDGIERNPFHETLNFEAIGDVVNAEKQTLAILRYHQAVYRQSNDEQFHDQFGYLTWDAATGDPVGACDGHGGRVTAIDFSHDGEQIASASEDAAARIWDVATRKTLFELRHSDPVLGVSFSRDATLVATGCQDAKVRLWNAVTGKLIRELDGHTGPIRCVKFAPQGDILATGGDDKTIRVWEVKIEP